MRKNIVEENLKNEAIQKKTQNRSRPFWVWLVGRAVVIASIIVMLVIKGKRKSM